jgi:hypothetical protein
MRQALPLSIRLSMLTFFTYVDGHPKWSLRSSGINALHRRPPGLLVSATP